MRHLWVQHYEGWFFSCDRDSWHSASSFGQYVPFPERMELIDRIQNITLPGLMFSRALSVLNAENDAAFGSLSS
jgi:hypothetical protein